MSSPIKLPPEVQFHQNTALLVYRPSGLLNQAAMDQIVAVLGELEAKLEDPFNRFTDTSETDEVELNYEYIIRLSLYRRLTYTGRPPVKSAILATDRTLIHYGRLHALLTQGSPINVRVFQDRVAAANWLNVPSGLLMPPLKS